MLPLICLSLLALVNGGFAHEGHGNTGPAKGETIQQYAQRHVCASCFVPTFLNLLILKLIDGF